VSGTNIIDKAQESHQTMTQTMSEILSLKSFSFKSRGLREWKAYDVDPGKPCIYLFQCTDTWMWLNSLQYIRLERETSCNSIIENGWKVPNICY